MARVGQKGRLCRRWWTRGRRPPGRRDQRLQGAYIFAAVEPATGADVALVLPQANAVAMSLFLAELAAGLPEDVQAVLVLDGAGWHAARALVVPSNITLVPLPPYRPELNPCMDDPRSARALSARWVCSVRGLTCIRPLRDLTIAGLDG